MKAYGFINIQGFLRENKTQIEVSGAYLMSMLQNILSLFPNWAKTFVFINHLKFQTDLLYWYGPSSCFITIYMIYFLLQKRMFEPESAFVDDR
jgi:hypothetical protein